MLQSRLSRFVASLALGMALGIGAAPASHAQGWDATHPRRAEVNGRLDNQDARIHQERAEGQISGAQAHQLHAEDYAIRTEERAMASQNGGHITTGEQRGLNQQENGVSRQIGR
jgi:hypothetical protein